MVYKEMYLRLFNAVTVAIELLEAGISTGAKVILTQAQKQAEEILLEREETFPAD